jgi:hypothetical protein
MTGIGEYCQKPGEKYLEYGYCPFYHSETPVFHDAFSFTTPAPRQKRLFILLKIRAAGCPTSKNSVGLRQFLRLISFGGQK